MANLVDDVTFHNGLVRTRLEKIGEGSGQQSATTAPTEAVMSAENSAVETTVSLQTTIVESQESGSSHTPSAPTTGTLCPQPQLQNSMPEQTEEEPRDSGADDSNTTPPPPPPTMLDLELLLPKCMAEVTVERAAQLLKAAKCQERLKKKREREELEGEFSLVGTLKKKLKTAVAAKNNEKRARAMDNAKAKLAKAKQGHDSSLWDDLLPAKPIKSKYTRLDIWQLGNKAARERKDEQIKAATVPSLTDARLQLMGQGWAIMDDWAALCDEACKPCLEQAEYILQTNDDNKHVIFENAVLHDNSAVIDLDTKRDKLGGRARMQLKPG
jgi:hypothetical protein